MNFIMWWNFMFFFRTNLLCWVQAHNSTTAIVSCCSTRVQQCIQQLFCRGGIVAFYSYNQILFWCQVQWYNAQHSMVGYAWWRQTLWKRRRPLQRTLWTLWNFTFAEKSSGTLCDFITGMIERNNCGKNHRRPKRRQTTVVPVLQKSTFWKPLCSHSPCRRPVSAGPLYKRRRIFIDQVTQGWAQTCWPTADVN